jgi:hypothetical protein
MREMLYGILASKSVLLSEIGRSLEERRRLIHTEKRLSRNLGSPRFNDAGVERRYLELVAPMMRDRRFPTPTIAVDLGDITKPRAYKMPMISHVHDGSTGEIRRGWQLVEIESVGPGGRRLPLCLRLFSKTEEGFKSQLATAFDAIRTVAPHAPPNSVWVFDRGFDGRRTYEMLARTELRFAIRMNLKNRRSVWENGEKISVDDLVAKMNMKRASFKVSRKKWELEMGWTRIKLAPTLPGARGRSLDGTYSLVVVSGMGKSGAPLAVISNVAVDDDAGARDLVKNYFRRWACEETFRFVKSGLNLENLRPLTWRGLKRIVLLTQLAVGYMAVLLHRRGDETRKRARSFRGFGPVPEFAYYRLLVGIAAMIRRSVVRQL